MAKSAAERIADYRERRKVEGMTTLSLVVPAADAHLFAKFAAERRKLHRDGRLPGSVPRSRWETMLGSLTADDGAAPHTARPGKGEPRSGDAELLVAKIVRRIIALGWPVDMPLGSERELMERHGASRTVLRQAIRLLEHHSIAHMRCGSQGGLFVARPNLRATARAAAFYLEYARTMPRDILTTRRILELATLELVIERLDDAGVAQLRAQVAAEGALDGSADADAFLRFHLLLSELSGDPALQLFTSVVLQLADMHSTFHSGTATERNQAAATIKRFHRDIAEAIIARDRERACACMTRYIAGMAAWLTRSVEKDNLFGSLLSERQVGTAPG